MASLFSPFRTTYRYMQRQAHEAPVIFYSIIIGCVGPVLVFTVPPVRRRFGYVKPDGIPTTYPIPNRQRQPVQGYDD